MKTSKKLAIGFLLILCLLLFTTACNKEDENYGEFDNPVETKVNETSTGVSVNSDFNKQPTELPYEWTAIDNGRAHIRIPYPKTWKAEMKDEYKIVFTSPADDPILPGITVYFNSPLEQFEIQTADDIFTLTESRYEKAVYSYNGSKVSIDQDAAEADEVIVNKGISNPNKQLQKTKKDWDVLTINGKADTYYYQETGFFWKNMPCVLSAVCENEKADQLNDLLIYMFSNSEYVDNIFTEIHDVTLFKGSGMTIPMSYVYTETVSDPGKYFDEAITYACPLGSGTSYSQSYLSVYETDAKSFKLTSHNFERKYLKTILKNTMGVTPEQIDIQGGIRSDSGYVIFKNNRTQEFVYDFKMGYYNKGLPAGCYTYQKWEIDIYPIKHKDKVDMVVLMAPQSVQNNAFDLIRLMSVDISYKN